MNQTADMFGSELDDVIIIHQGIVQSLLLAKIEVLIMWT